MPRRDIRMAPHEVQDLLAGHRLGVLAWLDEDGDVVASVVPIRYDADGDQVVVTTESVPGPVCVLVEEQPSYEAIRAVAVHGTPTVVPGGLAVGLDDVVGFDFGHTGRAGA